MQQPHLSNTSPSPASVATPGKGYVQLSDLQQQTPSPSASPPSDSVLMSPKGLKVAARTPYSKVSTTATLKDTKSTMV